ncbi:integrase, catalytic region, zinc finger, CCHC-type containing protein [Tanacetum coccineum]
MQEEIHEFERLQVWELVPRPSNIMLITLKWIFKVKLDEYGGVLKNKARLVAKGYLQEEEFDFEESFAPMDMKTAFLNGFSKRKYKSVNVRENSDAIDILMVEQSKLDEDPQGTLVDPTHYRSMVGSLMYFTASRSNLVFAVCMCTRSCRLPRFKKKYFGKCIVFGRKASQLVIQETTIKADAIALSCRTIQHLRTKHIAVCYHFIKDQVKNEVIELYFVKTAYQQSITPKKLKSPAESDEE